VRQNRSPSTTHANPCGLWPLSFAISSASTCLGSVTRSRARVKAPRLMPCAAQDAFRIGYTCCQSQGLMPRALNRAERSTWDSWYSAAVSQSGLVGQVTRQDKVVAVVLHGLLSTSSH
jgi:hypothetical protein